MQTFTLSEVVEITGLKPRTVQFWTLNGVLEPDPDTAFGGPGVPRRYPVDEVVISLVLRELARLPLHIGGFRQAAAKLRERLRCHVGLRHVEAHGLTAEAIQDELRCIAQGLSKLRDFPERVVVDKEDAERRHCELCKILPYYSALDGAEDRTETVLTMTMDDIGRWEVELESVGRETRTMAPARTAPVVWALTVAVNLSRLLAPLRERLQAAEADEAAADDNAGDDVQAEART